MEVWSRPWLCSLVYLRTKIKPDKEFGSGGFVVEKAVTAAGLNETNPAGPTIDKLREVDSQTINLVIDSS